MMRPPSTDSRSRTTTATDLPLSQGEENKRRRQENVEGHRSGQGQRGDGNLKGGRRGAVFADGEHEAHLCLSNRSVETGDGRSLWTGVSVWQPSESSQDTQSSPSTQIVPLNPTREDLNEAARTTENVLEERKGLDAGLGEVTSSSSGTGQGGNETETAIERQKETVFPPPFEQRQVTEWVKTLSRENRTQAGVWRQVGRQLRRAVATLRPLETVEMLEALAKAKWNENRTVRALVECLLDFGPLCPQALQIRGVRSLGSFQCLLESGGKEGGERIDGASFYDVQKDEKCQEEIEQDEEGKKEAEWREWVCRSLRRLVLCSLSGNGSGQRRERIHLASLWGSDCIVALERLGALDTASFLAALQLTLLNRARDRHFVKQEETRKEEEESGLRGTGKHTEALRKKMAERREKQDRERVRQAVGLAEVAGRLLRSFAPDPSLHPGLVGLSLSPSAFHTTTPSSSALRVNEDPDPSLLTYGRVERGETERQNYRAEEARETASVSRKDRSPSLSLGSLLLQMRQAAWFLRRETRAVLRGATGEDSARLLIAWTRIDSSIYLAMLKEEEEENRCDSSASRDREERARERDREREKAAAFHRLLMSRIPPGLCRSLPHMAADLLVALSLVPPPQQRQDAAFSIPVGAETGSLDQGKTTQQAATSDGGSDVDWPSSDASSFLLPDSILPPRHHRPSDETGGHSSGRARKVEGAKWQQTEVHVKGGQRQLNEAKPSAQPHRREEEDQESVGGGGSGDPRRKFLPGTISGLLSSLTTGECSGLKDATVLLCSLSLLRCRHDYLESRLVLSGLGALPASPPDAVVCFFVAVLLGCSPEVKRWALEKEGVKERLAEAARTVGVLEEPTRGREDKLAERIEAGSGASKEGIAGSILGFSRRNVRSLLDNAGCGTTTQ
uniref:Uncharacterized protein n=1 Tax=Chromera velia CCMP2878 TaxID=1169474 RepID=A0A0G4IAF9_9ALVE|eukprot:Cvel_12478.t1-p1 / transcript=Cvel_12478.t1 / gene=Cvel_12478 / organism=Chromera_velia_CCMP2878 / gene_product=hypothetical protein / transcript_product=hypothetical protein / location=Cvel_scaffold818:28940-33897(-) / protein_length=905 / sequence_SO=supercontig / SO=protein_coding / is_pseudo=false